MKVAIIDDDSQTLHSLIDVLKEMGFEPVAFNCPKLALAMLKDSDIYIALVDYHLNGTTGADFIRQLKQDRMCMECFVMTGDGYRETIIESMRAGASDFIRKPIDLDELENMFQLGLARLKVVPKLKDIEWRYLRRALAVCKTDKEAAEKLGIDYTTLYRKRKAA